LGNAHKKRPLRAGQVLGNGLALARVYPNKWNAKLVFFGRTLSVVRQFTQSPLSCQLVVVKGFDAFLSVRAIKYWGTLGEFPHTTVAPVEWIATS
jgi:hypothetical protein